MSSEAENLLEYYSKNPVSVSLADLKAGKCDDLLPYAFGPESLGIIIVKDLPSEFVALRTKVLGSASKLAHLPPSTLDSLEHAESHWLVGWSKGKEILSDGLPDDGKGSFYANCSFYKDPKLDGPPADEIAGKYEKYIGYTTPSLWPPEEEIPHFKDDLKSLCNLMIDTAAIVAEGCDRLFGGKLDGYEPGYLKRIVSTSTTTKARLLHYFPTESDTSGLDESKMNSWCGEHLDHSSLTALTSAMFLEDSDYPKLKELEKSPDPKAGLYIKNRRGETVKVNIPRDCLAFQTGSALQETTLGKFKAVPHFVRGSFVKGICRNTLAVFCQPSLHEKVGPNYADFAEYANAIVEMNH